jgi:LmbE family N-acetylglucosaminyl deacetylase
MLIGLPPCQEVLILAPHPDDEALGCAGTIALLKEKGVSVTVAFITDGESLNGAPSAALAKARQDEGRKAARLLGCREIFLSIPDGEVNSHAEEAFHRLSAIIEEREPEIVFAPSPIDYHADHIAASHIGLKLLDAHQSFRLAFYEVYSTVRFNCLVDITGVIETKKRVILNYRTSLYGKPEVYVDAALGLNAHRSIFVQRKGFFEAFYLLEKAEPIDYILRFFNYSE